VHARRLWVKKKKKGGMNPPKHSRGTSRTTRKRRETVRNSPQRKLRAVARLLIGNLLPGLLIRRFLALFPFALFASSVRHSG
jgi:hypothetical protein